MKAIVVGRHALSGKEGIEVIGNEDENGIPQPRPIDFPTTSNDCHEILWRLFLEAYEKKCRLIFQAAPGQAIVAAHLIIGNDVRFNGRIGQIVSVPGPRPAGVERVFYDDGTVGAEALRDAVNFVNPRAKVEIGEQGQVAIVTADPPMPFVFSHIEWYGYGYSTPLDVIDFFRQFGLPTPWLDEDGDIYINEDDNGEYPEVLKGGEVAIDNEDISIEGNRITLKLKTELTTDFFRIEMVEGEPEANKQSLIKLFNEQW